MAQIKSKTHLSTARNVVVPIQESYGISAVVNKNIIKDKDGSRFRTDCVLTYKNRNNQVAQERRENFQKCLITKQGLKLLEDPPDATTDKTMFVRVETSFETLLVTAENIRMKLPIAKIEKKKENSSSDPNKLSCWQKFKNWILKPFRLDSSLVEKNEVDYYTAVYSSNMKEFKKLFDLRGSKDDYFTPTERALLTYELLCRTHSDDHPRNGIDRLKSNGSYVSFFPLHEPLRDKLDDIPPKDLNNREKLRKYWATLRFFYKYQPMELIRSYMGEQVAFYFAVSGFYTQMLIPAAVIGVIVFIYGCASISSDSISSDICGDFGNTTYMCPVCDRICPFEKLSKSCVYSQVSAVFDNVMTIVFAALMSVWTRLFIELWKRREAELQYEWDSIDFVEHNEPIRSEYEHKADGKRRPNPVTERDEPYVSSKKGFYIVSTIFVLSMLALVCGNIYATIVFRIQITYMLTNTSAKGYSSIIVTISSAVINLIVLFILSQIYYWVAKTLTNAECHKYQSQYDKSFITKIYLFEFVNTYASIFYIAFFKGRFLSYPSAYGEVNVKSYSEQCDPAGCLVELSIQFFIIMTGQQIIKLIGQLLSATYKAIAASCGKCCRKNEKFLTQWEIDNKLNDFESNTLLGEYLNIVIQFGFVTLFIAAFPLAPLFALINNVIELRLDAWKFLSRFKRPIPFKAADIGIWNNILSGVSYLALLTNAVVIAWTSEFIPKMTYRVIQTDGQSLVGFVNWTLSSFPIADYNLTNTLGYNVPTNVTYCRYRDFRESNGPKYSPTMLYWHILAARLAFILVFEHVIFFIVYLIQWFIPDVPKDVQEKIRHERFLDQRERWASLATQKRLESAVKMNKDKDK